MGKKERQYSGESDKMELKRKTWNGYYQRKTKTKREKIIAQERKEKNRLKKNAE